MVNCIFYRDSNNFEIDVIMELSNADWAEFEIKTSGEPATLDVDAKHLINFKLNHIKRT